MLLLDPDEWQVRRRELLISWAWFFVGPAAILLPYLAGAMVRPYGVMLPAGVLGLGAVVFTVLFRLWAYYHVVRQHWGFVSLYRRKNSEMDALSAKADFWFFNLSLYAPLVMFMTSPIYEQTPGMPSLGISKLGVAGVVHAVAWVVFLGALVGYIGFQVYQWRQGRTLNGPKLLLLALITPLHLLAFQHPYLAALVTPIVTVGHNIQYHRIVWMYGQNNYRRPDAQSRFRAAGIIFGRFWIYFGIGLLFTLALYRGPWIDWAKSAVGMGLDDSFLLGVGMMAGLADPAKLNLGQQLFGGFLLG